MKKKTKLFVSILSLCVAVFCLTFGVYAATKVLNYSVEGSVVYDGDIYNAVISRTVTSSGVSCSCTNTSYSAFNSLTYANSTSPTSGSTTSWVVNINLNSSYTSGYISFNITNRSNVLDLKLFNTATLSGDRTGTNMDWAVSVDGYTDLTQVIVPRVKNGVTSSVIVKITFTKNSGYTSSTGYVNSWNVFSIFSLDNVYQEY